MLEKSFCRLHEKKTGLNGYVYNFSVDYVAVPFVISHIH